MFEYNVSCDLYYLEIQSQPNLLRIFIHKEH